MGIQLKALDKVEILTLQDNYVDVVARDNNEVVSRFLPIKDMQIKNSVLAEHGFSALVTTESGENRHSLLFDFGFSSHGAAYNAQALDAALDQVEVLALSHGHLDHVGGLAELMELVGKSGLDLVVHPEVFRSPRYMKISEELKFQFPPFTRENAAKAGLNVVETTTPYPMLGGEALFLGEIARTTDFEKGAATLWFEKDGKESQDTFEDDTGLVFMIKGKGLVILTGCAHSGIINTVRYAREVTGEQNILAVMGGFHLSGPEMAPVIQPTIDALKEIDPDYIIPTHCTGRQAGMMIEQAFPGRFLVNMAGTKMTFAA